MVAELVDGITNNSKDAEDAKNKAEDHEDDAKKAADDADRYADLAKAAYDRL